MKSFSVLSLVFTVAFALVGCENAEFVACKEKASKLWNPKIDDSSKQTVYWAAIKRCREKHE